MKSNIDFKQGHIQLKEFHNQENYNCRITTDSGQEYLIYANWLHNEQLDHWTGWNCDAGVTRLLIDKDFEIYSGECKNDHLGSALKDFNILDQAVCKQERCTGCTDDLIVTKHKS
jgi:hypothetical protein